ncbi:MAG: 23S rRNA (pseudouridine(1915)-N(3))-methyltransferase RlmH [Alphaproteobacteria bacterium]|nr:23S rRNA (pseudouridine(1915)-N(3))-methyltransferase RlmH [Alphaproteobacteria bacterium]
MRLTIAAVGHGRGTPEAALCEDFIGRARALGRQAGVTQIALEEVPLSKLRESRARRAEEGERLARRIPQGAHVLLLDPRGANMTSEIFAEQLAGLRDAATRDLAFVIGGPDGLDPQALGAAGSLAFGAQTWPHLLVRAMLCEQIYRGLTILCRHPYHRA